MQRCRGSFHQGQIGIFAGNQCTMIAFYALALSLIVPCAHWDSDVIDFSLIEGDRLYTDTILSSFNGHPTHLMHQDLQSMSQLSVLQHTISSEIIEDQFAGVVGFVGLPGTIGVDLPVALQTAFQISNQALFTAGGTTIGLIQTENGVFLFDSHSRNENGLPCEHGQAILHQFADIAELAAYLGRTYRLQTFNLSPVLLQKCNNNNERAQIASKRVANTHSCDSKAKTQKMSDKSDSCAEQRFATSDTETEMTTPNNVQEETNKNDNPILNSGGNDTHPDPSQSRLLFKDNCLKVQSKNDSCTKVVSPANLKSQHHKKSTSRNELSAHNSCHAKEQSQFEIIANAVKPQSCPELSASNIGQNIVLSEQTKEISDIVKEVLAESGDNLYSEFTNLTTSTVHFNVGNEKEPLLPYLDVRRVCEAEVEVDISESFHQTFTSNNTVLGCNEKYESYIRDPMDKFCFSCQRKMFTESLRQFREQWYCFTCVKKVQKGEQSCVAWQNNMDPGMVPPCIKALTRLERRFIAQMHVFMTVFLLPRKEQFGTKGIAINIPANPLDLVHRAGSSPGVLVSFESHSGTDHDFHHFVSVQRIYQALLWLKENNPLYSDLQLNPEHEYVRDSHLVQRNLLSIEESLAVPVDETVGVNPESYIQVHNNAVRVELPKVHGNIVNAYDTPHGEELCFPWLFCFGKAGYSDERTKDSSFHQLYPKARFLGIDDRFRKDMMYLLHFANVYERRILLNSVNIHMQMRQNEEPITYGQLSDFDFLSNSYMFMKSVRGTAGYFKNELIDLLAMIRNLGNPHLFVTFSPDEQNWPELIALLKGCTYDEATQLINENSDTVKKLIQADPVMVVMFIERKLNAMMKFVINGDLKPLKYPVKDYFIRREFQKRGSVHYHILLWLTEFPALDDASDLVSYINDTISTNFPNENTDSQLYKLVKKYQVHHHYKGYCLNNKKKQCRFKFPFRSCAATHLLVQGIHQVDLPYSMFYRTKRQPDAGFVNPYNPVLLRHWRGNTDIKVVQGAHGVAMYVCYYLNKAEPSELKGDLADLFLNVLSQAEHMDSKTKLLKIGSTVLKSRRMSCHEAAFKVTSTDLITKSRRVVCVNTMEPKKRYRILKSKAELDQLEDDSTEIFKNNIVDYYAARPANLETLTLFEFAQWYERDSSKGNLGSRALPRIQIDKYQIRMKKRSQAAIVRSPKFPRGTDEYFYSLLMLFYPHRGMDEFEISNAKDTFSQAHTQGNISVEHLANVALVEEIEKAVEALRVLDVQVCDNDPTGVDTNVTERSTRTSVFSLENPFVAFDAEEFQNPSVSVQNGSEAQQQTLFPENITLVHDLETVHTSSEYDVKNLNPEQKAVFEDVMKSAKDRKQEFFFVTGPGGTGKSYLIHCLSQSLTKECSQIVGKSPVIRAGPTGICSKNIHGVTLHSLLKLPLDFVKRRSHSAISQKAMDAMRQKFSGVSHLIIDELSMVSSGMLTAIHQQLCQVKQSDDYFGGLSIIAFGDFYQLKPVKGKFAFKCEALWPLFEPYFLETSVRHQDDKSFSDLCKHARIGYLTVQDQALLKSRLVNTTVPPFNTATHLYPTHKEVVEHNEAVQARFAKSEILKAEEAYTCGCSSHGSEVEEEHIPPDDRDCGGLPKTLTLSVGTKVILVKNLVTESGLVNGADGVVSDFEKSYNGEIEIIYVRFTDPTTAPELQMSTRDNAIAITKCSVEYHYKGHAISRSAFPIMPSSALTIHKMQGATKDTLVVNLGTKVFTSGMGYVALSRCKTLEGLAITELVFESIRADPEVKSEYRKLKARSDRRTQSNLEI